VTAWLLGVATLVQTALAVWGPFWPTYPDIEPEAPSDSFAFGVPFVVHNRSVLFPMLNPSFACYIIEARTDKPMIYRQLLGSITGPNPPIPPGDVARYRCIVPIAFPGRVTEAVVEIGAVWSIPLIGERWNRTGPFTWNTTLNPPRWEMGNLLH
jgi:hypothetical protein